MGVLNENVGEVWNRDIWFISRKHREIEEVENFCNILKLKWNKVYSKGKQNFLVVFETEKERRRVHDLIGPELQNLAISLLQYGALTLKRR